MDQLLRLLRARCYHCGYLKLHPAEKTRFICKLRLLQHGLLCEARDLEDISILKWKGPSAARWNGTALEAAPGSDEEVEDDSDTLDVKRLEFTKRAIRRARESNGVQSSAGLKAEAVSEERRNVIREFLAAIPNIKTCGRCDG